MHCSEKILSKRESLRCGKNSPSLTFDKELTLYCYNKVDKYTFECKTQDTEDRAEINERKKIISLRFISPQTA